MQTLQELADQDCSFHHIYDDSDLHICMQVTHLRKDGVV